MKKRSNLPRHNRPPILTRARASWLGLAMLVAGSASAQQLQPLPAADLARIKARMVCSCLFVQRLSMAQCANGRDAIWRFSFRDAPNLIETSGQQLEVKTLASGASVRFIDQGVVTAQSQYLEDGGGCVTVPADAVMVAAPKAVPVAEPEPLPRSTLPPEVDRVAVESALNDGLAASGAFAGFARAAILAHDGRVVMERYAEGFGPQNRYYLGSVAKVFNNLLAALLVGDGRLTPDDPVGFPEWTSTSDPRRAITFEHLLHMTSGLDWTEDFFKPGAPAYDVYFAGAGSFDVARYVSRRPLEAKPGFKFEYSTGAATLLAAALQRRLPEKDRATLLSYFSRKLFVPIGATGIVPEFDAAGTFLAGHSLHARPEDLLRVGLLLQQQGKWGDRQLLPEGWVEQSLQPAKTGDGRQENYGRQLTLKMLGIADCFGHAGVGEQYLVVCPRRNLVLVWFSTFYDFSGAIRINSREMLRRLILAFPERPVPAG